MNRSGRKNHSIFMLHKLNLSDTQKDEINRLQLNHRMRMVDLRANLQKKNLELAELKYNGRYTREQYISKIEDITRAKDEIAVSKANYQMDVYQLLDDEQKTKWNKASHFSGERMERRMKRHFKDSNDN